MRDRLRRLLRGLLIGSVIGGLVWVTGGDNFVSGFVAGLFVEEFMQLSTWLQEGLVGFAARWRAADAEVVEARKETWEKEIEKYPGQVTKLVAAMFIVLPTVAASVVDVLVTMTRKPAGWVAGRIRSARVVARRLVTIVLALLPAGLLLALLAAAWFFVTRVFEGVAERFGDGAGALLPFLTVLPFVVAAVSVLMLVVGGLRYVVSGGDQGSITSAKNTILYAVLGLTAAVFAFFALEVVAILV
ncbi:hypothetical protein [Saccharothrix sp.]|uniref:hypothetical protein n=1 Tax=Saccharothrix sp. TaxID=1873460 RepID=UPI002811DF87|nr:hypothetical protein [Saccharothrix sp.]